MKQQKKKEFWMVMVLIIAILVVINIGYIVGSFIIQKETTLEEEMLKDFQDAKTYSFNTETKFTDEKLVKIVKYEYILNIFHIEKRDVDVANLIIFATSEIYEDEELISLNEETYTYNISELGEVIKDNDIYVDEESLFNDYILIDSAIDTWVGYDEKLDSRSVYFGLGLKKIEDNEHVAFLFLCESSRQMIHGEEVETNSKNSTTCYYELDKNGKLIFGNMDELFRNGESV